MTPQPFCAGTYMISHVSDSVVEQIIYQTAFRNKLNLKTDVPLDAFHFGLLFLSTWSPFRPGGAQNKLCWPYLHLTVCLGKQRISSAFSSLSQQTELMS